VGGGFVFAALQFDSVLPDAPNIVGSNPGWDTGYAEDFHGFTRSYEVS
jgi:hypothetical protein